MQKQIGKRQVKGESQSRSGTQAIGRAVLLLRLMARGGTAGSRLGDFTKATGLPYATVHRILKCLIEERLVVQDEETGRYRLGMLNVELSLAVNFRIDFRNDLRPVLEELAEVTGETVSLTVRSGSEAVCLDIIEGKFPLRTMHLGIGGRRPLSFGAGGMALLSQLDEGVIETILHDNERDIANSGRLTMEGIRRAIESTRARGYAIARDTSLIGVSGVAMVVPSNPIRPPLAITVAMVSERINPSRAKEIAAIIGAQFVEQ